MVARMIKSGICGAGRKERQINAPTKNVIWSKLILVLNLLDIKANASMWADQYS